MPVDPLTPPDPNPRILARRIRFRRLLRWTASVGLFAFALGSAGYLARFEFMRWREALPPFTHSPGTETTQLVPMSDGINLSTTSFLPEGDGPWPAILIRNPYERFDIVARGWCGLLIRYGYACVYQDVRGQMSSEGDWIPLSNEGKDGRDTLKWLTARVWQDGNIGLFGPSYLAAVQWAAASEGLPPEVKTFIPTVYTTDSHRVLYENGMFRHETFTAWAALNPSRGMHTDNGPKYQAALKHRPHIEADETYFGGRIDWYRDWITSPNRSDPVWQQEAFQKLLATPKNTTIPVLMIGGWYDVFFGPQLDDFQNLASRENSRLVVGPWTHVGQGGEDLETPGAEGGLAQWNLVLDWLGHHLKGEPLEQPLGVSVYVMGQNEWVERPNWPPPTRSERLYLSDLEHAQACEGGRLVTSAPANTGEASYVYDPNDPVPTRGGAGMLAFILPNFEGAPPANVWQAGLCERDDILTFTTDAYPEGIHLAGPIEINLTVSSDAADTAFTARLIEVFPDGRAINIRDGIMSLAYRAGLDGPIEYRPDMPVKLQFSTWPIEWVTRPGSKLRLDVSSSDYPKYHAHPNRAGLWSQLSESAVAKQTLWSGPGRASFIALPVAESPSASTEAVAAGL